MKDPFREAMDAALRLLKFRGRTEKEMGEKLARKGADPAAAGAAVARLKELNLLNDEALARQWTQARRKAGQGENRIRQALWQRGVPRDIIALALSEKPDGDDAPAEESARAWQALTRRAQRTDRAGLDQAALYRRLAGHLARQGFSPDVSREALQKYFSGRKRPDQDRAEELPS